MIDKLKRNKWMDVAGYEISEPPSLSEITDQINEIIEYINSQEENKTKYIHHMSQLNHCPNCGHNEYLQLYSSTTLLNIPEVYKDGVLQESPVKNKSTTTYQCLKCGHTWAV